MDVKAALKDAVTRVLEQMQAPALGSDTYARFEVIIQDTPPDKPGDYGTPVAFLLAKALKQSPVQIAAQLAAQLELPAGIARAEAVGPYLNFFVDRAGYIKDVVGNALESVSKGIKVIVEHTSVNPNKELHVGHLRNVVLGDAMARVYRAAGYSVEVQNYIDDTGRQAADSLFAQAHYGEQWDGSGKYDHWLGELYVRLHQDLANEAFKQGAEPGINAVMHRLEAGELRTEVEKVVRAQLETCYALGVEYDLLVWESDIVGSGFLDKAMKLLEQSEFCFRLSEGKYAGCFVMDTSRFLPGLEDPILVLLRSNGTATYTAKDIAQQFWKFGLFEGLDYTEFESQPSGKTLYATSSSGSPRSFAHAGRVINVIDSRQSHPQAVVKAAMAIAGHQGESENSIHLSYNTVLLEGQTISGRKGITVSMDEVIEEAILRASSALLENQGKNSESSSLEPSQLEQDEENARRIGLGALRFAMLKNEPSRQIDFHWDSALALVGDTAPYVQYAAVRAKTIQKRAALAGLDSARADFTLLSDLELTLAKDIARLPEILGIATRDNSPHPVAQYALELANGFNGYYNHKDSSNKPDTKVIDPELPDGLQCARLAVVERMAAALEGTLNILGIEVPSEM
ncbi:MAG: arginine--tRNA ligase [Pseudopedobacter sp.]|nr:arginine--tRNA ligase [Deinococcales bacterium]